ncbi:ABC transporter ATP-binding protein [Pseudoalteromonas denitrificans]|uniref:Putative ABC transport system ATP-binding protein n=1 Tax=Pseudoalteromonas denitrificans DSM 6059 TaxID=1123010 RepID=A0A1I1NCP4_9GAMM|nr:ABC transporter ATP-binding protein [Pseudoalteromonas denitrificans]SFC92553.1 putative ABC transport system ATP-binding protein [Pseudoalteromonas denitrificans DSM 6059]
MLKMSGISKHFIVGNVKTQALHSFELEIKQGDFVAVVGPSGSGKTTFLNMTGMLEQPSFGQYEIDGVQVANLNDKESSRIRNEKIGFVFQSFNLIPELNVYDNVDVPLRYRHFSSKERKARIENALEQVGLAGRHKHFPPQLSGGQQQRVAIARALAGSPSIILADEPTGNLDSKMADGVMALLHDINKAGTTIVMVTHNDEQAQQAGRIVHISDGYLSESTPLQQAIA